jgi:hypothetical protein
VIQLKSVDFDIYQKYPFVLNLLVACFVYGVLIKTQCGNDLIDIEDDIECAVIGGKILL